MPNLDDILSKKKDDYLGCYYTGNNVPNIPRLPIGIFSYDLLTNGGNPKGKITQYWGAKGSGKTTTALRSIGSYLRTNKKEKAIFMDFEHKYNPDWAKNFIDADDLQRLLVVTPDYAEQGIDMLHAILKADDVNFAVVDSVAAMTPSVMGEKSAIEDTVGMNPKVVNKMLRKLIPLMIQARRNNRLISIIVINQVRAMIGVRTYTPILSNPCGHMLDHALSLDVFFREEDYVLIKNKSIPMSVTHKFTIMKNAIGLKKRSGRFTIQLIPFNGKPVGYVDEDETVIDLAKKSGALERIGNKWKWDKHEFKNLSEVTDFFGKNTKEMDFLKLKTMNLCMKDVLLTGEDKEEN